MSDPLFHVEDKPTGELSPAQVDAVARGGHPLEAILPFPLGLRADAPPADDRKAAGPRCGNCRFRWSRDPGQGGHAKCLSRGTRFAVKPGQPVAPDVAAWWPACRCWEPEGQQQPDAKRWTPMPKELR